MARDRFAKRFGSGETESRELDQVVLVLFSQFLKSEGGDFRVSLVGPGLWLGSKTLCLRYRSLKSLRELSQLPARIEEGLKRLIVVAPFADQEPEINDIQANLQRTDWKTDRLPFTIWSAEKLLVLLQRIPPLCVRYFPDLVPKGKSHLKKVQATRGTYDRAFSKLNSEIQFVGMSVYKEEASTGVEMEKIYIPLRVVPEGSPDEAPEPLQKNPLTLLTPGACHVILGDPGSGKSTLLRFLALAGMKPQLLQRYAATRDDRLPVLITLRRYAEALQEHPSLGLLDHAVQTLRTDLGLPGLDRGFVEYYLYAGQGLLLLDGVDELPSSELKATLRERVADLVASHPGNTVVVTSRIVGYERGIRFDDLGFSHHRVARLGLQDIRTFVHDWYRARISSQAERNRHSYDLIRILEDPDSRPIRELAENPLLLTIICLVHRIDAELPDERVVLYQKCTETLLNTWHNWKFRGERDGIQSRSKVERRNRSRMEAIAYWMHATLEEGSEEIRRAVVPFEALRDFLAEYIQETERPRDEDSFELAEHFLRFVKERAGLLIEVGSGHYSFLHLTFQEYLTATHLRKSGETAGIQVIWPFIEKRCGDPKWHEVIRLLVGALERTESQKYLLEQILPRAGESGSFERALLAGGCLIDGVDAAEEMRAEILSALLHGAARAESLDLLQQALRMLRAWETRGADHHEVLRLLALGIANRENALSEELALSLIALGWDEKGVWAVTPILGDRTRRAGQAYDILCTLEPRSAWPELERKYLQNSLLAFSITNVTQNLCAAVLAPMCFPKSAPSFEHLLGCTGLNAPFNEFFENCLAFGSDIGQPRDRHRHLGLGLERDLKRDWEKARARAKALARSLARELERDLELDLRGNQLEDSSRSWPSVLANPALHSPILEVLCELLALAPRPHWREVLRLRALPHVPKRLTLTDPEVWESTRRAFRQGTGKAEDSVNAASQLLLDVWLWVTAPHDRPEDSPFAELAEITRASESPCLRIAHCIRDIAYGAEARIDDLRSMVESDDPAYRKIFEEACWR